MKANLMIKAAMKAREKWVLGIIKQTGVYRAWDHGVPTTASYNAVDRLEAAGKVKYSKKQYGYIAA